MNAWVRDHFDNDMDGLAKYLMSRPAPPGRFARYPEPPPARCLECDDLIDEDDYDQPMLTLCQPCRNG